MCICISESPCYAPKTFCQLYFNKIYILRAHTHTHIEQLCARPWWRRAQKPGQSTLLVHRARRPASGAWRCLFPLPGSSSQAPVQLTSYLCSRPGWTVTFSVQTAPAVRWHPHPYPTPALPTPHPRPHPHPTQHCQRPTASVFVTPQHTDLCGIRLLVGFYYLLSRLDVLRSTRTLMSQFIRQDPDAGED